MPEIKIKTYAPELKNEWDHIVLTSKNGNFLHLRNYMDYHADRFIDQSILIYKNDKPIAALPCNKNGNTIISHGGLTYGGLLTSTVIHASDILEIFEAIKTHFHQADIKKIVYKTIPSVFHRYPADEDLYALTRMNATLFRRDLSSVIDMTCKPKFSDSRKNTARKAAKANAECVELNCLTKFHTLLSHVLEKFDSKPVHSLEELQLLKNRFPEQIRLFGAVLDEELLAAALIYDFGHIVHTQYLASSDEGRQLGALDFLLMHLIENTFADKKYFSFGISTEDNGKVLNEGLSRQKEGFGGRGIVHDFYEWVL